MSEPNGQLDAHVTLDDKAMTDLGEQNKQLKVLVTMVAKAGRRSTACKPDTLKLFREALRMAESFNWEQFVDGLRRLVNHLHEERQRGLQERREKLLQSARDEGEPFRGDTRTVRVGIFDVTFEGESVVVGLGGVEIERTKEVDGKRLFQRLRTLRKSLEEIPFNREDFFRQLKTSYATCRGRKPANEFVAICDLHCELVLERARNTPAFRKRPGPKNVPAYPLHQFVFDLARFIQKGVAVREERLVTRTPSMRESRRPVSIPNLDHPLQNETTATMLAIQRSP